MNKDKPAFPWCGDLNECPTINLGMTLRDYFAAKALPITYQYWMTDYYHPDAVDADIRVSDERGSIMAVMDLMAEYAYEIADAMLKAREE